MYRRLSHRSRPVCTFVSAVVSLFFCVFGTTLSAQQPVPASSSSPGNTSKTVQDTTPLFFTFALNPERSYPAADTLPERDFRFYDPARRMPIDWGTLGNLGSATQPLFFETPARLGFDVGVHVFDLYNLQPKDLRFYRNSRSFSEVFFTQGGTQQDGMVTAKLARTFSGGTTFSMDYRSINNLGQYRYQRTKHNALLMGLWVPVGERYDGFLIFSKNVNRQQDNGGIVSDTVFGGQEFSGPIDAEVRLSDLTANSRLGDQTLQLTQHLRFVGDETAGKRVLRATHTFAWRKETWKFSDGDATQGIAADSLFFSDFLVDRRGLRNYIELDRIDNSLTINTFKSKKQGRPSDVLALGIAHSYFSVRQEPNQSAFSNLFLTGQFGITPSDRFALTADAALGILKNIGEYQLRGNLTLGLGNAGILKAGLLSQRYPVDLLARQLFVSKRPIWNNDFEKPVENTLFGSYALPLIGFEVVARTHLSNNYIYYDQNSVAQQTGTAIQVVQLLVNENLRVGHLHLDNTVALQRNNRKEILRLPDWFSKNSLYYSGNIFKKRMLLNLGVDFRINSQFQPDAYQPLSWQFHLQDTLSQKPYPWIDVFAAFKVQSFRFFFRYENLSTLWNKTDVFYQTASHPQPFGAIRLGITWRFMDSNLPEKGGSGTDPTAPPGVGSAPQIPTY